MVSFDFMALKSKDAQSWVDYLQIVIRYWILYFKFITIYNIPLHYTF